MYNTYIYTLIHMTTYTIIHHLSPLFFFCAVAGWPWRVALCAASAAAWPTLRGSYGKCKGRCLILEQQGVLWQNLFGFLQWILEIRQHRVWFSKQRWGWLEKWGFKSDRKIRHAPISGMDRWSVMIWWPPSSGHHFVKAAFGGCNQYDWVNHFFLSCKQWPQWKVNVCNG